MAQQTAVEWLIGQLRQLSHSLEAHLGTGDIRVTQGMIDEFEEQAKKMEKEQAGRMYSEEDLLSAFEAGMMFIGEDKGSFKEWFEQLKKK